METLKFNYRFLFALLAIIAGLSNCKKETNTFSPADVKHSSMANVLEDPASSAT